MTFELLHNKPAVIEEQLNLELLHQKEQSIPNAIMYSIKRYRKPLNWNSVNQGVLHYSYDASNNSESRLNLMFCVVLQEYCLEKKHNCDYCKKLASSTCVEFVPTVDYIKISFTANNLKQFYNVKNTYNIIENIVHFKHKETFTTSLSLSNNIITILKGLLNHSYTGSFENIYFNAQTQMLLIHSFESLVGFNEKLPFECKFLATETEREKIVKAREILIENIGEPLTIKTLSRKVAINECYLKKGFKELFGQTIFDFYQSQRMEHAKFLLYVKGLSVTEVSEKLGYSSISHFSIAFKKFTGIKPCELLFR